MSNWTNIQNIKAITLKKFLHQVLGNKIANYDDLLTRLSTSIITDNDMALFGKLINDILETGYKKAIDDYKDQLKKMGIEVNVKN